MIDRSLPWKPLGAYTYFADVLATGLTLGVVVVFLARNPATAVWALVAVPLYLLAFFLVTETIMLAFLAVRSTLIRGNRLARVLVLAAIAGFGGIAIATVFWWSIESEAPPVWAWAASLLGSAAVFGWYAWRYELVARTR